MGEIVPPETVLREVGIPKVLVGAAKGSGYRRGFNERANMVF